MILHWQGRQNARDAGENAEKVAYEEYGALIGGIGVASFAVFAVGLVFVGPGLIILTVVGGISALVGAELGVVLVNYSMSRYQPTRRRYPLNKKNNSCLIVH
ncbi:hypothetical protein MNBD_GAMMA17-909 [hydrothermal vent metagenome]|uniref:Uncharacterized protein n=1 Tax=hydrothermal vent metagenome TaxID=652676 RepID=A0A3B0ZDK9_9ZZZZ